MINIKKVDNKKSIDRQIILLQQKFKKIKELGYVESIKNSINDVGITFEKLIGKEFDNLSEPDFFDIEIKTKLFHNKNYINLININPTGPTNNEIKRIKNIYGYRDKKNNNFNTLNIVINGKNIERIRNFFLFKIEVNRKDNRLYLIILDINFRLIERKVYWDLDIIKNRIYKKINVVALISAFRTKKNNKIYFKYYKINFYILKDFNTFIKLIENGKIKVIFKISNYYTKEKYGQMNSHGIGFVIKKEDILELFDIYK